MNSISFALLKKSKNKKPWLVLWAKNHHQTSNAIHNTKTVSSWLVALSSLPAPYQSPSSSPPPPPSSNSSSHPRPTSHIFPPSRFSSEVVSHYLSEIKTTIPRIPQNLRGLRRGVRQEVVFLCVSIKTSWCDFDSEISSSGCLRFLENGRKYIEFS